MGESLILIKMAAKKEGDIRKKLSGISSKKLRWVKKLDSARLLLLLQFQDAEYLINTVQRIRGADGVKKADAFLSTETVVYMPGIEHTKLWKLEHAQP